MAKPRTQVSESVAPVAPVSAPEAVTEVRYASARQAFITNILAGKTNAEIKPIIDAQFPHLMASEKFKKHVGWYRGQLKKEAKLRAASAVASTATAAAE